MTVLEGFSNIQDMAQEFNLDANDLVGIRIIYAGYATEPYSGEAFVLFEKDGKLYEVNGGHCSCYGLEGQWSPDETTWEDLAFRAVNGTALKDYPEFLEILKSRIPLGISNEEHKK